ncbi:hypothetical protein [Streptomyces spongiicola]|uniref:hypothetical protein n=1 Tax=Streptomyces spongiicola TaxID=1690221 RepID=UPI001FE305A9|nr:hypothetical protein [Streptomyces spongiicola]
MKRKTSARAASRLSRTVVPISAFSSPKKLSAAASSARSMEVARYRQPSMVGSYVLSPTIFVPGSAAVKSRPTWIRGQVPTPPMPSAKTSVFR